jgi:aspartate/glutamate racemase
MPEISIEPLNMNFTINNRGTTEPDSWKVWYSYFNSALHRLEKSGAEIISIASVTPHARLSEISLGINAKMLCAWKTNWFYLRRN